MLSATVTPFIKSCCISSLEEMHLAVSYGVDAIGLVGKMPSGPGPIEDDLIRSICKYTPPPVLPILLTSRSTGRDIVDHVIDTCVPAVQIVRQIDPGHYEFIRTRVPWLKCIQVIHVEDSASVKHALEYQSYADALLLDSGNSAPDSTILGGTGNRHDWSLSREIVEKSRLPVFLAGGLRADNIAEAIKTVRPFGVDLCSGLRDKHGLNEEKLSSFVTAVRNCHT